MRRRRRRDKNVNGRNGNAEGGWGKESRSERGKEMPGSRGEVTEGRGSRLTRTRPSAVGRTHGPPCAEPTPPRAPGAAPVPSGREVGPGRTDPPAALSGAGGAGTDEEGAWREGGAAGRRRPCGLSSLFFSPLSFFTRFSFQTGKSVPRSGRILLPLLPPLTLVPARVRALGAGARAGSPSTPGSAGRGTAPAAAHGRSHPARTPTRRAQLARGPSAVPSRPRARQRLSGEVAPPGIGMTLLLLLCLGECLWAGGGPEGPREHPPAPGAGRLSPQSLV